MTKIPVLHIIKSLGRGGAEMLLPETLKLHDKVRFEFHYIYFLPWKDQMVESIREIGGIVTCFPSRNNFQLMFRLWAVAQYIRKHEIQLIHAHLPWAGILARMAGKMTGVPVLYTEHNKQERYHWATRTMNLWTLNMLTKVIAVSSDVAESIHKNKPDLTVPVQTIANGVNIQKFNPRLFNGQAVLDKFNIPSSAPVIGTIAVFRSQKRLDLWMELAAKILEVREDVHFIMVGDGPLKGMLIRKRNELGLNDRIHMPGLETEVRPYLAVFDIFMMTSVFEGLPVALLEAMAMECAVVATDAGGTREVIRHEKDGLLCAVDEPEKLTGYALSLLRDEAVRLAYGMQGRRRVEDDFSMERLVRELENTYSDKIIYSKNGQEK